MQFPVGVALRDLANFAAGQVTRAISQQKSSFSHPFFAGQSSHLGWCHQNMCLSKLRWLFRCFCGKTQKTRKRDQKWQEREGRVVNLQTVVFSLLSLSCDSRANIMVSLCLTQWEFWLKEAITHNMDNCDYLVIETNGTETSSHHPHVQAKPQKVPHTSSESLTSLVMLDNKLSSVVPARYFPAFFMLCLARASLSSAMKSKSESQQRTRSSTEVFSACL